MKNYTIAVQTNDDNYDDMIYGLNGSLSELLNFTPNSKYIDHGKVMIVSVENRNDEEKITVMFEWDKENNCWTSEKLLTIVFAMMVCGLANELCDYMKLELMEKGAENIQIYNDHERCEKEGLKKCPTVEFNRGGASIRCTMKEDDEMLVEKNDEVMGWLTHHNIWKIE